MFYSCLLSIVVMKVFQNYPENIFKLSFTPIQWKYFTFIINCWYAWGYFTVIFYSLDLLLEKKRVKLMQTYETSILISLLNSTYPEFCMVVEIASPWDSARRCEVQEELPRQKVISNELRKWDDLDMTSSVTVMIRYIVTIMCSYHQLGTLIIPPMCSCLQFQCAVMINFNAILWLCSNALLWLYSEVIYYKFWNWTVIVFNVYVILNPFL